MDYELEVAEGVYIMEEMEFLILWAILEFEDLCHGDDRRIRELVFFRGKLFLNVFGCCVITLVVI